MAQEDMKVVIGADISSFESAMGNISSALGDTSSQLDSLSDDFNIDTSALEDIDIPPIEMDTSSAQSAIDELSQSTVEIDTTPAQSAIEKLSEKIKSIDSASIKKLGDNISSVGGGMSKWVTGPIAGASAGIFALATSTGNYADSVLDLRDITGLSTDSIQEWQHVAKVAGVNTDAVTNATEGLIKKMPNIAKESGPASEALETLGLSAEELEKMSPDDMIDTLMGSLADLEDPMERNALGSQLFGGSWKDIAPILGMGADAIQDTKDEAHELGTVMGEDALGEANGFRIEMDKLQASLGGMGRELAMDVMPIIQDQLVPVIKGSVIPAIKSFAQWIGGLAEKFGQLSPTQQKVAIGLAGILAAIGPVLLVVGKMVVTFSTLMPILSKGFTAFKTLGTLLGGPIVTAIKAVGLALKFLAMNPVGLIIVAVVGLAFLIWKYWDEIVKYTKIAFEWVGNFLSDTWTWIKETVSNVATMIVDFFKEWGLLILAVITGPIGMLALAIYTYWDEIKAFTMAVFDTVKEFLTDTWEWIKTTISNVANSIVDFFKKWGTTIIAVIIGPIGILAKLIYDNWDAIKLNAITIFTNIKNFLSETFGNIKDAVVKTIQNLKNDLSTRFGNIRDTAKTMFNKVREFIENPIETAKKTVLGIIDTIKGAFEKLKIKIPKPEVPSVDVKMKTNRFGIPYPSFDIGWMAKGGIATGPSLVGVGEAGDEAIIPLSSKSRLKPFASAVADLMPESSHIDQDEGGKFTFNIPLMVDGREIARSTARYTREELERLDRRNNRMGGII